ncbi:PAS domain-containing sensor histidine kinase [Cystobacter fuscus]|uniref:histidine kinase n=1 Tax=Cystobacter fuscus TaxID=43 RepID=A0A250IV62_9BACT|nr:PAS domain-containing sensor histidine kinase [Cystobacter fuscus]ATB35158.1 PAS domain-containing sensor histidine kinase [Cystobacter fuscus]
MTIPSFTMTSPDEMATLLFQVEYLDMLRAILDSASEGMSVVDTTGRRLYMNEQCHKLLGISPTDPAPDDWSEEYGLFLPDTRTLCPSERLPMHRAFQTEEAAEEELFVRNRAIPEGRYIHVSARPIRDRQGKHLGAVLYVRDIHEQRLAEAERRRTELRFQRIVEAAQEGLWMIDGARRVTYVNRFAAELLGYTPEEIIGRDLYEFLGQEEVRRTQETIEVQRQGQTVLINEFKMLHKDGTHIWTMISTCPLNDEGGSYEGSLAIVIDIRHRREAEQQVHQLNAQLERRIAERTAQLEFSNRELEAFAYSVAHDLRTPLRSISNFTLALTEDCADKLDATGLDYVQRIRAASRRMADLIDGILSLSRVNRTEFIETDVDLSTLAHTIREQLQRWQPQRTARFHIQEGLVDRGDAQLLGAMLENLLGNAWKFSRGREVAEIEFGTLPPREGPRVYFVRDNGDGFDMEYQKKLFGVFQRLHTQQEFEGNGVGLATVQRIIQRHGGDVWGEGRVGQGATFYFTLHAPAGQHASRPPAPESPRTPPHV